jgi:hypothetical protein
MTLDSEGHVGIGNGSSTTEATSILELSSTTKGFLAPRMTTTQKNAITTPATGLNVYDTTLKTTSVYNGTKWMNFGGGTETTNGYTYIGTLIIQWGVDSRDNDNAYNITFPIDFTTCLGVFVNRQQAGITSPINCSVYTSTNFTIDRENNIDGVQTINWFALGI